MFPPPAGMSHGTAVEDRPATESGRRARVSVIGVEAAALAALALGVRLIQLDYPPFIDELNHVLAARSLLESGTLVIADGPPYIRARLFTYLVAGLFGVFGESLVVARIPGVLAGTAMVLMLFLWLRADAGRWPAWIAASLLCFYPHGLFLSQLGRFYPLHAALFLGAAWCVYRLGEPGRLSSRGAATRVAIAVVALGLAYHLHPITLIGAGALVAWVALARAPGLLRWIWRDRRRIVGVLFAVAALALLALGLREELVSKWTLFQHSAPWAASNRGNVRHYYALLRERYGLILILFPVALVVAAAARPRLTGFFACMFGLPFVAHSLAAWKAERFLFYVIPAFFAVAGLAIAEIGGWIRGRLAHWWAALGRGQAHRAVLDLTMLALAALTMRSAWYLNGAFPESAAIVRSGRLERPGLYPRSDWDQAAARLDPLIDSVAVVVASPDVKALYFLDRLDFDLTAEHRPGKDVAQREFAKGWRTGRPVISTPESIARVIRCYRSGLIVVEATHWGVDWAVPAETAAYIVANTTEVTLPPSWRIRAYRWGHAVEPGAAGCDFAGG